jgi:hypothetical protein
MGYYGFTQVLCSEGHYEEIYSYENDTLEMMCGHEIAWRNEVDDTNGDKFGFVQLRGVFPAQACPHCCGSGIAKRAIYKLP